MYNLYEKCKKINDKLSDDEKYAFNVMLCEALRVGPTNKRSYLSQNFDFWWHEKLISCDMFAFIEFKTAINKFELKQNIHNTVNNIIDK